MPLVVATDVCYESNDKISHFMNADNWMKRPFFLNIPANFFINKSNNMAIMRKNVFIVLFDASSGIIITVGNNNRMKCLF
jgi:hypothetical protein